MKTTLSILLAAVSGLATWQWMNSRPADPSIPRTPDGQVNLTAPAPRADNGKPDLSGVWHVEPTGRAEMKRIFGKDVDTVEVPGMEIDTISKYAIDILLDHEPADAFMKPEAAAIFRERAKGFGRDLPSTHCLPTGIPLSTLVSEYHKIVQTPNLILVIKQALLRKRSKLASLRTDPRFIELTSKPNDQTNTNSTNTLNYFGVACVGERTNSGPTGPKTLPELQTRISEILAKPELRSGDGRRQGRFARHRTSLFEENAKKLLRPASNMKLYTVAAALDKLSPDYRFITSVYGAAKPDASGVIRGDLTIYGRGDPTFAARFNNGDYFKGINNLAARIVSAGVKRVEGDLVGDESYFVGPKYGSGWEWEDLTWYYGAEISPLTVNDNALDLFIKPGRAVGQPALITTGPPDPLLTIVNKVMTPSKGTSANSTFIAVWARTR